MRGKRKKVEYGRKGKEGNRVLDEGNVETREVEDQGRTGTIEETSTYGR